MLYHVHFHDSAYKWKKGVLLSNRLVSFHQSSKNVSSYSLHFGNICKSSLAITSEFPISLRKLTKVHVQPIIECVGLCTLLFILIKFYSGPPCCTLCSKKKVVLTVITLKNLSTICSCLVFLQECSGPNFYKESDCSSLPHRSGRSSLMIGGHWARINLKAGYHYRKASIPLSPLACGPCEFIVSS